MKMLALVFLFTVVFIPGCGEKKTVNEIDLSPLFMNSGYSGCFAMLDLKHGSFHVYNMKRYMTGFLPASTFKILNSLIILETGTLPDENTPVKWDGIVREYPGWNTNLTLREAFKLSAVWVYQAMARKVGTNTMQEYIEKCDYGNKNISAGVDKFWLEGKFFITPLEQLLFLRKFYLEQLPFSHKNLQTVKSMMLTEEGPGYKIFAKTGLAVSVKPNIGWWIGFVETSSNTYFFAVNIESSNTNPDFMSARIDIGKQALKQLKIIP
jgi:beta-lactamase class D